MSIDQISNDFVGEVAALSPLAAVYLGLSSDRLLDDLSPDGLAEQVDVARRALQAAAEQPSSRRPIGLPSTCSPSDSSCTSIATRPVTSTRSSTSSPRRSSRCACCSTYSPRAPTTTMPTSPSGCERFQRRSPDTARACAKAYAWVGWRRSAKSTSAPSSATPTPGRTVGRGTSAGWPPGPSATARSVRSWRRRRTVADASYAEFASFLRDELRPQAPQKDAVGHEPYALASRDFLGATIDLEETYHWGWEEFLGLEAELIEVGARIRPGAAPRRSPIDSTRTPAIRSRARMDCSSGCSSCPTTPSPS